MCLDLKIACKLVKHQAYKVYYCDACHAHACFILSIYSYIDI